MKESFYQYGIVKILKCHWILQNIYYHIYPKCQNPIWAPQRTQKQENINCCYWLVTIKTSHAKNNSIISLLWFSFSIHAIFRCFSSKFKLWTQTNNKKTFILDYKGSCLCRKNWTYLHPRIIISIGVYHMLGFSEFFYSGPLSDEFL